jgi:hypothetical protein
MIVNIIVLPENLNMKYLANTQRHHLSRQLDTEQEHKQRLAIDRMQRRDFRSNDKLNSVFSYNHFLMEQVGNQFV